MSITLRLEAYAKNAKTVISAAQALADARKHAEVEPVHLLYELVDREADVEDAIERSGVDPTDVLVEAELVLRKMRTATDGSSYLSPRMLDLLGRAEGEAARQGGVPVGVEHLFLACAQETSGTIRDVFKAVGLSAPILRATLGGESTAGNGGNGGEGAKKSVPGAPPKRRRNGDDFGDPIEAFGRDLTRLASQGKFDPTVGRDAELRRMLQVLARRRENNPLLVGEPGIGKTTIVNALAQRMAVGDVPNFLKGKRVVALEMGSLVAGASLRGQLEERTRAILDAVRDSAGEILLFLPDLGALTGKAAGAPASSSPRRSGAASCARWPWPRRTRCARPSTRTARFSAASWPFPWSRPRRARRAVLRGVVERFEIDHGVRISRPGAGVGGDLRASLRARACCSRRAPIDLIDEAAARVRVEMDSVPAELDIGSERRLEAVEIQRAQRSRTTTTTDSVDDQEEARRPRQSALHPRIAEMDASAGRHELKGAGEVRRLKEELAAAQRELDQARGQRRPRARRRAPLRHHPAPREAARRSVRKAASTSDLTRDGGDGARHGVRRRTSPTWSPRGPACRSPR